MKIRLEFEPRDIWIGVYWTDTVHYPANGPLTKTFDVYICILPCFPLHIETRSRTYKLDGEHNSEVE